MSDTTSANAVPVPRGSGGRWLKGCGSPNPAGRPKESYQVSDLAKQYTPEAVATLVEVATDKDAPAAARVSAAEALLNRGWGRPVQSVEARIEQVDISSMHLDALRALSGLGRAPAPVLEISPAPPTAE